MAAQVLERMPGRVKFAVAGVWAQAVTNLVAGGSVLSEVDSRLDHGQEVASPGLARGLAYFSIAVAVLLAVSSLFAQKRFGWVWTVFVIVETLAVVGALFGILAVWLGLQGVSETSVVISLVLPLAIGGALITGRGQDWFSR
ncbi:hypothetical protein SBI_04241 [Streptomyces bingchenggensis BCW-1]|uniref:Integral membrane protein n=1 Tax=Streptomyces bingchenggensis (strain BCW-1) TaxID=749414 RepID=D7BS25_STRBB|nr:MULTISPECIES: hypothetical protein [Streptomyces]ADI07362.1 hypothetical protein SBI_04241 [Streptomyces bingchenggensis BCW-1]